MTTQKTSKLSGEITALFVKLEEDAERHAEEREEKRRKLELEAEERRRISDREHEERMMAMMMNCMHSIFAIREQNNTQFSNDTQFSNNN